MRLQNRLVSVALATAASASLGACATLGIGQSEAPAPVSAAEVLKDVPKVENSPHSPCWQQRQIAAQRAYIDSNVGGKPVMYHADDCEEPAPAAKPKQAQAKTS